MISVEEAYAYCRKIAFAHYENFPAASVLLPQPQRNAVAAIYAFARQADDYSDEPQYENRRIELLENWRNQIGMESMEPVFIALNDAIHQFSIPTNLLTDLISAFRQDIEKSRYQDFNEVLDYCRRSANPVGRLVLRIFNLDSTDNCTCSDSICTALQLANFWQDLASDCTLRDRIYLPQDELMQFGVRIEQLKAGEFDENIQNLMRMQVARTRSFFIQGVDLPARLPGMLRMEIGLTLMGGMEILKRIQKQNYNTLAHRPVLARLDWGVLFLRWASNRWLKRVL